MGHKELTEHQRRLLRLIRAKADEHGRASIEQASDRRPATLRQAQGRLFRALERRGLIEIIRTSSIGPDRLVVWCVRLLQPENQSQVEGGEP